MSKRKKYACIYIPIWRIKDILITRDILTPPGFTFQYGGLRTAETMVETVALVDLHSNMED